MGDVLLFNKFFSDCRYVPAATQKKILLQNAFMISGRLVEVWMGMGIPIPMGFLCDSHGIPVGFPWEWE